MTGTTQQRLNPTRLGNYLICSVCGRPGAGHGYAPSDRHPIAWLCDDPDCIPLARDTYRMPTQKLTRIERLAVHEGGDKGGEYLDEIGKTDLAVLTEDEWREFLERIEAGRREALVTTLKFEAPF